MKKWLILSLVGLFMVSCSVASIDQSIEGAEKGSIASMDYTLSGANGTVVLSGMSGNKLTVTYSPGVQYNSCNLYVSAGNGTGLVLAAQPMTYSGGKYTYTLNHSTFTSGAKIYVAILRNNSGVETIIPQGTLATTTSWASFSYGAADAVVAASTPGRIEGENYAGMSGVITETCSEGGKNVGSIDAGDWMYYPISISQAGTYTLAFRVASIYSGKSLSVDYNAGANQLGTVAVPNTGSWQTYTTVYKVVTLPAGTYNLGINAGTGGWNLNWFSITSGNTTVTSPGQIEGENYAGMSGVMTETCSEGGKNVGSIDAGDWMYYPIKITTAGSYKIEYRVASIYSGKNLSADYNAGANLLGSVSIPNTGSWQTYTTVSHTVNLPAGSYNFGINGGSGGWNLNWFKITYAGSSTSSSSSSSSVSSSSSSTGGSASLIALASGKQMTIQFVNKTSGAYADSQIYVLAIARNSAGVFCTVDKNGNMNPCVAGGNGKNYSIKLSDMNGMQFPTFMSSGRLYVSYGSPLDVVFNQAGDGSVGIAFPNIENPSDANINKYFDWIEFAVLNNEIWCNLTQVDQFGFPMLMSLYTKTSSGGNAYFGQVGTSESRASIYAAWNSTVPSEFKGLASTYRIIAPIHYSALNNYFDSYINQMWSQYTSSDLVVTIPQGTFTGRVQSDGRLRFTKGDGAYYYVSKPTTQAVWGGLGALATGNTIELVLEAQICAAFHRHVVGNASTWNTPSAYYKAGPCDYYSKFWHDHSVNGKAYGFCYDDVNDESSTLHAVSPRGIILSVGF